MLIDAVQQGGTAETPIGSVIESIDNIIDRTLFPNVKWCP